MGYKNRNDLVAVGTSKVQLLPLVEKDGDRIVFSIKNTSTNGAKITLAIGNGLTPVSLYGIVLDVGENWTESIESTFMPTTEEINAISNIAGGQISIYERRK
jgi:hypothetical protein